jgi:hypothetical protein
VTELPPISAVPPWPGGYSSYPTTADDFTELTEGTVAKAVNDLQAAIEQIESALGTTPAGSYSTVKAALDGLQNSLSILQGTQTDLAAQVAALEAVPGPINTYYNHTQASPAAVWTITHNLGRKPAVTVTDSAGTVVEGEVEFASDSQVILTFSAAFAGYASLS